MSCRHAQHLSRRTAVEPPRLTWVAWTRRPAPKAMGGSRAVLHQLGLQHNQVESTTRTLSLASANAMTGGTTPDIETRGRKPPHKNPRSGGRDLRRDPIEARIEKAIRNCAVRPCYFGRARPVDWSVKATCVPRSVSQTAPPTDPGGPWNICRPSRQRSRKHICSLLDSLADRTHVSPDRLWRQPLAPLSSTRPHTGKGARAALSRTVTAWTHRDASDCRYVIRYSYAHW